MTMEKEHPVEALQELLDERLAAGRRAEVERHVAECERCRRELEVLRWTRQVLRDAAAAEPAPASLERQVLATLDREDGRNDARASLVRLRWPLGLAAAAVVILGLALVLLRPGPDVPTRLARDFADYRAGHLTLERTASDVASLERFFGERQIGFDARVLDLGMMAYTPVGARVHSVDGRPTALFVYRGPNGQILVCQMFLGRVSDLPETKDRRFNKGIEFRVYERDGKTVVAWQEGPVVCVLVSDMPREEVVPLAFAKAMKV